MKVLVSGSTGLVGEALVEELRVRNHHVTRLERRRRTGEPSITWDPAAGKINPKELEGFDAVVNLSGENIASGRWTPLRKRRIKESRLQTTQLLSDTFSRLDNPPKVFISASAVGYYGNRPGEKLSEVSSSGQGFLADVCRAWEDAANAARSVGTRVVNYRFGVVLSGKGGALKAMYWPFQLGLAGNLSINGKQHMPWVSLDDAVGGIVHCLEHPISGPVNAVAPQSTTNAKFTDTLRRHLIPAFLPMHYWTPPAPAPLVQLVLGEMGKELLLADMDVKPVRLEETGYRFKYPDLKSTFSHVL
ncbi:MAG: TIGR01777 family oxidoreductase [Vampirovibrionales bacterium]|nr:TIGR01777 family oxidoreductase [Vampirovibrionales bacterium]